MTNDLSSDKQRQQQAEQLFYLELKHTNNSNINSMLSDDERIIWDCFTDKHKNLFKSERDWEWKLMCSLRRFSDTRLVTKCSDWKEIAASRMRQYQQIKASCESYMSLDDLMDFLFPLVDLGSDRFRAEVIEQIKREDALSPRAFTEKFTEEWEIYEAGQLQVMVSWLESTDSNYLKQGASIWRGYLKQSEQLVVRQDIQPSMQVAPVPIKNKSIVNKNQDWEQMVFSKHQSNPALSHKAICEYLATELGVSAESIRRKTTNPKPRKPKKS